MGQVHSSEPGSEPGMVVNFLVKFTNWANPACAHHMRVVSDVGCLSRNIIYKSRAS